MERILRLVEDKERVLREPKRTEGQLWAPKGRQMHSLHYVVAYPESTRPEVADYCIRRFSKKGDRVLDPFCGRGTVPLQAALLGREAWGGDLHPLAVRIAEAKLKPVGLDEVVLRLNEVEFRRPVDLSGYHQWFRPFYHPDTYRELFNLRAFIQRKRDQVNSFIELLAFSRLHGHTPAYLSVYSFPQMALTPQTQVALNKKRGEEPEYRSVAPRIIRKAAEVLRDGLTKGFYDRGECDRIERTDARRLSWVPANSVDLVLTAPPIAERAVPLKEVWLELWFANYAKSDVAQVDGRAELLRDSLAEMLRVVKPEGYVVLELSNAAGFSEEQISEMVRALSFEGKRLILDEVLVNQGALSEPTKYFRSAPIRNLLVVLKCVGRAVRKRV